VLYCPFSDGTPKIPYSTGRSPVEKFTDGNVHVSIWENNGVKGAFRTASIQLRYKDQDGEWQTGTSYGQGDLKHLESAAKEARTRIDKWTQENKAKNSPSF
jgi:hypothetical protein